MAELTVWWSSDGDEGYLDATATSGDFSGHGCAWLHKGRLHSFITAMRTYPLPASAVVLEGGYWIAFSPDGRGPVELGITIKPYNSRGALLVHVELASEMRMGPEEDIQSASVIRFVTDYETLDKFSADFEAMIEGRREKSVLRSVSFS